MWLAAGNLGAATIIVPTGVDWTRGADPWIHAGPEGDISTYFVGVIFLTLTENGTNYYRDSLCVDLYTDIILGNSYSTTVLRPDQVPGKNLGRVSWLIDNALLPTESSGYTSALAQADWVRSSAQGAGIQLAVWDMVHDGGDGFAIDTSKPNTIQASWNTANPTDATVLYWANRYLALSQGADFRHGVHLQQRDPWTEQVP